MRVRQKKSGSWEVTVEAKPDPITGERQQVSRSRWPDGRPCTSKTDARKRGEALLEDLRDNFNQPVTADTVSEWLATWLEDVVRPNKAARTHEFYASIVKLHVTAAFKKRKLRDITPVDIDALAKYWRQKGLSLTRQRACWATMQAAFSAAKARRLISISPFVEGIEHATVPKRRPTVLKPEQLTRLLAECERRDHRIGKLLIVKAHTAARLNSLLIAQESDYDREARTLLLWDGKNDSSKRIMPLDAEAVAAVEDCLRQQRQEATRWKNGVAFTEHWLFRTQRGHAFTDEMVDHWFQNLRQELDLPYTRPHDLRHFVASAGLAAGLDIKVISAILGHSSSNVTREIYQHVLNDGMVRQALELVADQLRGGNAHICPTCHGTGRVKSDQAIAQ